jgi:hypothetical protein
MRHKHHIIPKHMGGSDDPSNLVILTREEHAQEHLKLYKKHGKKEDLGAYYLLTGQTDAAMKIACSLGGKVQGIKNKDSGHMKKIQRLGSSIGGKKSSEVCRERQRNAFFDPILRKEIASKGGCVQGKQNVDSGHLKRIAQLPNKRNSGMFWITDGNSNKMISEKDEIDDGWRKGKTQKRKVHKTIY